MSSEQREKLQSNFQERCDLISKVTKNPRPHFLWQKIQIWKKLQLLSKFVVKSTLRDFPVSYFGYRTKSKTRKPRKFSFFLLNPLYNVRFLSQFIFVVSEF